MPDIPPGTGFPEIECFREAGPSSPHGGIFFGAKNFRVKAPLPIRPQAHPPGAVLIRMVAGGARSKAIDHEIRAHHGRAEFAMLINHLPLFLVDPSSPAAARALETTSLPHSVVGRLGAQREEMSRPQIRIRQWGRGNTPLQGPVRGLASSGEVNGVLSSFESKTPHSAKITLGSVPHSARGSFVEPDSRAPPGRFTD